MLGDIALRGLSFAYGMVNLGLMMGVAGLRDKAFTNRTSNEAKRELKLAQSRHWSLDQNPLPGFTHEFFQLKNGAQLHYVVNPALKTERSKNVAIFIHGFPDSYVLWRQLLQSEVLQSHVLIAVDLPGYGGSDNLKNYGPEEVLEAVTAFILAMREKYLRDDGKLVVVTHDWGGIVGARLASEAHGLADRWIIASAIIPKLLESNARTRLASAKSMLHTWIRWPFNTTLLRNAWATVSPVTGQLGCSFYVFVFQLPRPFSTFFVRMGNYWLLRALHHVAAGLLVNGKISRKLNPSEAGELMSGSTGPGEAGMIVGNREGAKYSPDVSKRSKDHGMSEKIRLYREHLLLGTWEKSLETVVALSEIPSSARTSSNSGAGLFESGPPGALKAPATIIYGKNDAAFESRLALEGISDYLTKRSQVLMVNNAGHWLPLEGLGCKILEDTIEWALGEEDHSLKESFIGLPGVRFVVEK